MEPRTSVHLTSAHAPAAPIPAGMGEGRTGLLDPLPAADVAPDGSAVAERLRRVIDLFRQALPQGQLLPEHIWRRRHATIVVLLWLHVFGLALFGLYRGYPPLPVLAECGIIAVAAPPAGWERARFKLPVRAPSFGLITSSAVLTHLAGGHIEAHFHFFVMIGVLTLYQDWLPFLLAIGYVVIHHGIGGVVAPASVYSHAGAIAHPWKWALIHGGFVLAASAAHVIAWRTNENQLLRDPLTGLPSRILFLNRLSQAIERLGRRPGQQVAVMFLDLDRFKVVNDSHGHPCGDGLLVAVADRLRHVLRRHETIARFGGDEFAVMCEDISDEQDAIAVAERVLKSFSLPFALGATETVATASVGISLASSPDQNADELVRDADAAMYRAKEQGGGRYLLFDEVTRTRAVQRLEGENALRRALEHEEFRVYFQPEVSIETNEVVGLEALVRWEHPEQGLIAPGEFIALAEETGLIVPIGAWVLAESCRVVQQWQAARPAEAPLTLRVNVSARQLADDSLPALVSRVLHETRIDPAHLCLEVTESVLIEDPECSARTLGALKALGVQLAVDDFGTGYSSIEYLRRFPVDCLKIDRSFIRGLPHNTQDVAIVGAVVDLAHALSLSVAAEGVETAEQLGNLEARGCDTAQGFYFARPQPPEVIESLLDSSLDGERRQVA